MAASHLDGRVGLEREHETLEHPFLLEQLGPGELVGECDPVDQLRTPYTARAITAVQTLRFQHLAIACTMDYQSREVVLAGHHVGAGTAQQEVSG